MRMSPEERAARREERREMRARGEMPATSRTNRMMHFAERLDEARVSWKPMYERVKAQYDNDPDISRRAAFALLPFDIAMTSANEKIVVVAIDMLRRMYGHDEKTVNVNDGKETLDQKVERWKRELSRTIEKAVPEAVQDGEIVECQAKVIRDSIVAIDSTMPRDEDDKP